MVMQDPKYSLNPVITVGKQIEEAFLVHTRAGRREARERTLEMLAAVRIRNPERVYRAWPHEMSGGMGQRIMIAMMMIPSPEVIIADEPTSALDVTVRMQVLAILDDMVGERGMGLMMISHDLNLVASFCDRVIIMYGGQIMETLDARDLGRSSHGYTRGLMRCLPGIDRDAETLPVLQRDPAWLAEQGPGVIELENPDIVVRPTPAPATTSDRAVIESEHPDVVVRAGSTRKTGGRGT